MTVRRPTLAHVARDLPATPEGCVRVLAALREHRRPMSLSLLTSRMPPVVACLLDLIAEQEEVSINDCPPVQEAEGSNLDLPLEVAEAAAGRGYKG